MDINPIILIQDETMFWIIQGLIVLVSVYGFVIEKFNENSGRVVKRGKQTNNIFYIVYGILSVVLLSIIQTSSAGIGYKTTITLLDLLLLLYLCFFNSWSRNKIIGIYIKFELKIENL